MIDWVTALLVVGAAARITRFVTLDTLGVNAIRKPVYNALSSWPGPQGWWDSLTGCVYCLGFWVTIGVYLSAREWGDTEWWWAIAFVLSASMAVAWVVGIVARATEV